MTKLLYLAGPRDAATEFAWVHSAIHSMLDETGWVVYSPHNAFTVAHGTEPDSSISAINYAALEQSDGCVAYLPDDVFTIGTPMEIEYFLERGLPVAIVGGQRALASWSLGGVFIAPDIKSAIAYVVGVASQYELDRQVEQRLRVDIIAEDARLPTRAHDSDAGFDLYCSENTMVPPHRFADIQIGICIQPPPGVWCRIIGRSSLFRKAGLLAIEATIDHGYRGPLYAAVYNMLDAPYRVDVGDRLVQLIPMWNVADNVEIVEGELEDSDRGVAGFGSTGK